MSKPAAKGKVTIRININRARECLVWLAVSIVGEIIPGLSFLAIGAYCAWLYQQSGWKGIIQFLVATLIVFVAVVIIFMVYPPLILLALGGFLYWYLTGGDITDSYWEWSS